MKKFLAIQIKQIGDCIVTEPIFHAIKKTYPESKTFFLVSKKISPLFQKNPYIDEVIPYYFNNPLKMLLEFFGKKFDFIFDFLGNPRSRMLLFFMKGEKIGFKKRGSFFFYDISVERNKFPEYAVKTKLRLLEAAGIKGEVHIPQIYLTQDERIKFDAYFEKLKKPVVAISPTSRRQARRWKKEYFAQLADKLKDDFEVVFVWGPGEIEYVKSIVAMTKSKPLISPFLDLRELASFLSRCDLLVSNDNGPRHIAVAVGTPTLTIHGPSNPVSWKPPFENHRTLQADIDCKNCGKRICEDLKCMEQLKPDLVEKEIREMLKFSRRNYG
ncbi:MAG: glycosyltransferase family 9 protein [Elusimicrobia bacterium]|nr:glycosyltransferase family 9 protein [Elusimicrobiota bacterium]